MRIVIRFHEECKTDVLAWLASQPGQLEDRRRLLENSIDELKRMLARTAGHPSEAEYRETPPPPCFWWKYTNDCWVRFTIRDEGWFFGPKTRTVEVIGFEPDPPS